ncbi:MAG: insulinase family protein, partial [Microvirga sp.]
MNLAETGTRTASSPTQAIPVAAARGIEAWHVPSPVVPMIAIAFTFEG